MHLLPVLGKRWMVTSSIIAEFTGVRLFAGVSVPVTEETQFSSEFLAASGMLALEFANLQVNSFVVRSVAHESGERLVADGTSLVVTMVSLEMI